MRHTLKLAEILALAGLLAVIANTLWHRWESRPTDSANPRPLDPAFIRLRPTMRSPSA